jgi:hypothetical protein
MLWRGLISQSSNHTGSSSARNRSATPLRLDRAPIKGSLAQFSYINWLPDVREQEYVKLLEGCRPPDMSCDVASKGGSTDMSVIIVDDVQSSNRKA